MALDFLTVQDALADAMFNGDTAVAGAVIFTAIMAVLFAVFGRKNLIVPFVLMIPAALIASMLGIIPTALTILVILASALVISSKAREAF